MITYVFINGTFSEELSDSKISHAHIGLEIVKQGINLHLPKNCIVPLPIRLHFISNQPGNYTLHNTIYAEENSSISIIEEYSSLATQNYTIETSTNLQAEKNASINYFKVQKEHITATHKAAVNIQQKQDSRIQTFFADFGSLLAHENIYINLAERNSECQMYGLYRLHQDKQQLEHKIFVDHVAEYGKSNMLYKGILDKKSQATFHGKVYVHPRAFRITANQGNHNLLLSSSAEVKTKPELEIYADDVKCSHGATVGQLDEEALFYLRARGIDKKAALALLTKGFANDVIDKIDHPLIRDYITQQADCYDT